MGFPFCFDGNIRDILREPGTVNTSETPIVDQVFVVPHPLPSSFGCPLRVLVGLFRSIYFCMVGPFVGGGAKQISGNVIICKKDKDFVLN